MSTITLNGISVEYSINPSSGNSTRTDVGLGSLSTVVSDDHTFEITLGPDGASLDSATGDAFALVLTGLDGLIADSSDPLSINPDVENNVYGYVAMWSDADVAKSTIILELDAFNTTTLIGNSQLFTLGGDALPGFADLAAYEAWRATVTSFDTAALLFTQFAPGTPFDIRDIPNAVVSEDDAISGPFLPDYIDIGVGNDAVTTGLGEDTIIGGGGDDTLNGGASDDFLMGNADNDRLIGGGGNDIMFGGTGNDTMNGNVGIDEMFGGAGNDRMRGGAGEDEMFGNGGDDTMDGGRNDDEMNGGGGNDLMDGEHGHDLMFGGSGDDTIEGGDGRDTLNGGSGNDQIIGGDGRDRLVGNSGDDTLNGGRDNDVLRGGEGADVFVFGDSDGQDRIADFIDDVDRLEISSGFYSSVNELLDEASEVNGDVILYLTPPPAPDASGITSALAISQILIENTTIAQLTDDIDLIPLFL